MPPAGDFTSPVAILRGVALNLLRYTLVKVLRTQLFCGRDVSEGWHGVTVG